MKRVLSFLLLLTPLGAKGTNLPTGEKYDFIAKDGQHLYDATLVKETRKAYIVTLPDLEDESLTVEKSFLAEPPRRSALKKKPPLAEGGTGSWQLGISGELFLASGALADYVSLFPGVALRLGRSFSRIPYLGVNALRGTVQYAPLVSSPRRIDMVTAALGPVWGMAWQRLPQVEFWLHAAPAFSVLKYNSYTFDQLATSMGAVAGFGADWRLGRNVALTSGLQAQYLHDESTTVLIYSAAAGVIWLW